MAGRQKEKVIRDEVHQNQILRELYLKELRTQILYTQYHVNPLRKVHTIARKPMSWHDNLEEPEDARFLNLIHHAAQGPRKKYPETQTESQEIGWDSEPLVVSGMYVPYIYKSCPFLWKTATTGTVLTLTGSTPKCGPPGKWGLQHTSPCMTEGFCA
uniref:Family with sequence similarity 183 member A n=1 Tax=Sus scrofa TaxID=9823 RepID=A0A8D0PN34_PIG